MKAILRDYIIEAISYLPKSERVVQIEPNRSTFETYFETIHEIFNNRNSTDSKYSKADLKKIYKQFRRSNVRAKRLGDDWWLILLSSLGGNGRSEELISYTQKLMPDLLSIREWLHIYIMLTRLSLFSVSFYVRSHAMKLAVDMTDSRICPEYDLKKKIGALIETDQFEKADENFHIYIERFGEKDEYCSKLKNFLIFTGGKNVKSLHDEESDLDNRYLGYIEGQSVAIVGPAVVGLKNAAEIDSFDRVLRFNYREKGLGLDPIYNGTKVDISCFNNNQAKHLAENLEDSFDVDLDWILVKRETPYNQMNHAFGDKKYSIRKILLHNDLLFFGQLHGVPNCAIDLLRFSTKAIMIFNADLTLTKKYHENYDADEYEKKGKLEKLNAYAQSNAMHDLIAQFNILKLLWNRDKISGDSRFNEVMALDLETYIKQIDHLYGYGAIKKLKDA